MSVVIAAARELGLLRPPPSDTLTWYVAYEFIHDHVRTDPPVLEHVRDLVRAKVAADTSLDPTLVILIDFTGPYLAAATERLQVPDLFTGGHPPTMGAVLGFALGAKP